MPITIKHDGPLDIATGRNRKETNWKNKESTWHALLTKLSATHRTAETYNEYLASKKPRQDEIKDVGGFVGGYLAGGRRKSGAVTYRQVVTLDIDFAQTGFWDDFTVLYGCAAAIYSTHKHSPDKPRLRLIIPLDRHVLCDEYTAIARRLAGEIGIDYFDHTTYQPERLMYWPSTSKDGVYEFEYQDGPWLRADDVLATYRDWTDSSEWPVSDREGTIVQQAIKKQGDPLEKTGVVGAFCRTFTIHEAIDTFLPDIYTACDIENRYTYTGGSTSAGMVTYEDKYAYSHHGTDPISMKLCNAFDLVRIHKFGLKDEDARDGTAGNKLPSFTAMLDFATSDVRVRTMVVDEKRLSAQADFEGIEDDADEAADSLSDTEAVEDESWKGQLKMDKRCNIFSTVENMVLILQNDPKLKGRFSFDTFRQRPVIAKKLPWKREGEDQYLGDKDESMLYLYLEQEYGITAVKLATALDCVYEKNKFHPVRDYLGGLKWDGTRRLDTLLIDYMGCDDSPYIRAITRKTFVAAVARIYKPGVKFDSVLTLVGEEGRMKSTLFAKMGRDWFSDSFNFNMLRGKEGCEQIQGVWLMEIGEMAGLRKADQNEVKSYIARDKDSYRPAYGRNTVTYKRQGIFVSTTNEEDFLQEGNGHRRIWPAKILITEPVKNVSTDLTASEVDQLWSEALMYYKKGETLYLPANLEQVAKQVQRAHTEEHPWTGVIREYLDKLLPENWDEMDHYERLAWLQGDELQAGGTVQRTRVCPSELWCEALGKPQKDLTVQIGRTLRSIMRSLTDWTEATSTLRYGRYGQQRRGYLLRSDVAHTQYSSIANDFQTNKN